MDFRNLYIDREYTSIPRTRTRKPRLLYILHDYFFGLAGTEKHTRNLSKGLQDQYDIRIAFPYQNQVCLIDTNEKIMRFPADPPEWPITRFKATTTERFLSMIINSFNPDIIHIQHFINWPLSIIDQLADTGKPVVMSFHDYYSITPQYTMQVVNDVRKTLSPNYASKVFGNDITSYLSKRRKVIARSLKKLPVLIVPSRFLAKELYKIFPFDYQVIEHGIPSFKTLPKVKCSSGLRFGCLGSSIPQKGWAELVEAFTPIQRKFRSMELSFYGGQQGITSDEQNCISFHGAYQQKDLPRIFSEIDIGVIPSLFREAYSLVLSEMLIAGLPVACSDIGALGERIINGKNGKKFPPGDIEAMTITLLWFIENDTWKHWNISKPRLLDAMLKDYDKLYQLLITLLS